MSNPGSLVLHILDEGRINVDEAAALLAAVGARTVVRVSREVNPVESAHASDFLPVLPVTAWSGTTSEVM